MTKTGRPKSGFGQQAIVCQTLHLKGVVYQIFEKYKENSNHKDHETGLLVLKATDSSEKYKKRLK